MDDCGGRYAGADDGGVGGGLTPIGRNGAADRIQSVRAGCPPQIDPGRSSCRQRRKNPPAKAQATVTLKHLAATLSDSHDLPRKQAEAVLGDLVTLTTRHLKRGDKIRLNGIGIFQVRKRAARMGRNPATGAAIKIRASKKVAFRVAKELKEAV